jgi:hypothetical protein
MQHDAIRIYLQAYQQKEALAPLGGGRGALLGLGGLGTSSMSRSLGGGRGALTGLGGIGGARLSNLGGGRGALLGFGGLPGHWNGTGQAGDRYRWRTKGPPLARNWQLSRAEAQQQRTRQPFSLPGVS